jgi:hypothetical protein
MPSHPRALFEHGLVLTRGPRTQAGRPGRRRRHAPPAGLGRLLPRLPLRQGRRARAGRRRCRRGTGGGERRGRALGRDAWREDAEGWSGHGGAVPAHGLGTGSTAPPKRRRRSKAACPPGAPCPGRRGASAGGPLCVFHISFDFQGRTRARGDAVRPSNRAMTASRELVTRPFSLHTLLCSISLPEPVTPYHRFFVDPKRWIPNVLAKGAD